MRDSNQASILASLFPPETSYFTYLPLDIATRVLKRKDRCIRTAFLQNLCGTSLLARGFNNKCHFCQKRFTDIHHYIFECVSITAERTRFLNQISQYMKNLNPKLENLWTKSIAEMNHHNSCAVLFGGNYVLENDNDFILFRKSHRSESHQTDRTVVMTAEFSASTLSR